MSTQQSENIRYLCLGNAGVGLHFPDDAFTAQACQHIFLDDQFGGRILSHLNYIVDDTLDKQLSRPGLPNVVTIKKTTQSKGVNRIYLQMFAQFTVALDFIGDSIIIRYPSNAPIRLLLDDVLQAALQPVLDRIGGFILHGACMARSTRAIVFMGNSGAGKSTTAYNLARFGYHCYADDAVLVTPVDNHLVVWPLSREFSLRPLSFNLFKKQGISLGPCKKEGEKYYFSQTAEGLPGAKLKHICFLELSGEEQTTIKSLDEVQTLAILSRNDRHFSFMGRNNADKYARSLAKQTPAPIIGRVGTNLEYQGGVFNALCSGRDYKAADNVAKSPMPTREEKLTLIKQAWMHSTHFKSSEIIPLLGDYDPKVFALALSLFQNLPTAKLWSLANPGALPVTSHSNRIAWIDVDDWLSGCKTLLSESSLAVLEKFAISWIRSAPLLYTFFKVLLLDAPDRLEIIEAAWEEIAYQKLTNNNKATRHLLATSKKRWFELEIASKTDQLWVWIPVQHMDGFENLAGQIKALNANRRLTLVPILGKDHGLDRIVELYKQLWQHGLDVTIHRTIPLCGLTEETANYLLASHAFDYSLANKTFCEQVSGETVGSRVNVNHEVAIVSTRTEIGFTHRKKPFGHCRDCAMSPLGLCRGGFFRP